LKVSAIDGEGAEPISTLQIFELRDLCSSILLHHQQTARRMSYKTQCFINGVYVPSVLGKTFETINPATGEKICDVSAGTAEDINLAVAAAKACLESETWGLKSTGAQRAVVLRKLGEVIEARKEELAMLDSLDNGKPLREALADMGDCITCCNVFADLAEQQDAKQNEVIENGTNGDFITTIVLEPLGVVGGITPWNYPLLMGFWKVAPCIATGCPIVLKPSELAPLSCILLGELCNEAGLPPGALNIVPGLGMDAGPPLTSHPDVAKVSFTGSCLTGKRIMASASSGPRGVTMELGGKSPIIVFEDAHIDSAVDWLLTGILWGSGQVCSATSRALVHSSIRDVVVAKLIEKMAKIKVMFVV